MTPREPTLFDFDPEPPTNAAPTTRQHRHTGPAYVAPLGAVVQQERRANEWLEGALRDFAARTKAGGGPCEPAREATGSGGPVAVPPAFADIPPIAYAHMSDELRAAFLAATPLGRRIMGDMWAWRARVGEWRDLTHLPVEALRRRR